MMKTLICSPIPWMNGRFGATRVVLDFAEALDERGEDYDLYPPVDNQILRHEFPVYLHDHILENIAKYDVIDFPFHAKPWIQKVEHPEKYLFVTRVVLLPHHEDIKQDPAPELTLYQRIKELVKFFAGRKESKREREELRRNMDQNMEEADLINVANRKDKERLIELGYREEKIIVLPYGLTKTGVERFAQMRTLAKSKKEARVAFVGTFDFRKGCLDFPEIVERVVREIPEVKFRLLGTKGMFQTEAKVLSFFPRSLWPHLEIYPVFEPSELPELLSSSNLGMFPSYREGFGIAVVEKLASGLPVVAYDVAGPCDILPEDWLVEAGDIVGMSRWIITMLKDRDLLEKASARAITQSELFGWSSIAEETIKIYRKALEGKQTKLLK